MTPTATAARDWLLGLVCGLVPEPASVDVEVIDVHGALEFHIIAPPAMRSRIIGREGKTINLVRALACIYAQTNHLSRINVLVSEPERSISRVTEAAVR